MEELFPEMVSAVLMPNHLHIILPKTSEGRKKLGILLASISRRKKRSFLWQPVPQPHEIPDLHHLRRQVRYVALNPCRKKLCHDPLEWCWSTYRDVMGASVEKLDRAERMARTLKETNSEFRVRFHAYVSSDPSVSVTGTTAPLHYELSAIVEKSVGEILRASAASLRVLPSDVERRGSACRTLFIKMAYRHGWGKPQLLATLCKIEKSAVHRCLNRSITLKNLEAADLCLVDARLRKFIGE